MVTYDTPGHYTTRLTVTTSTGSYDLGYRHISIYDRPENGTHNPILKWNMKSMSGSREAGGYSAKLAVYENFGSIQDGALVVIFADDYYGATQQSIGNSPNRGKIVFVGYIMDGSITVNYQTSAMEFDVGSPTEIMKQIESFAVGVNSSSDPSNEPNINENIPSSWAVVKDMDCRRAIYHYLRWHSTVLMTNDFEFIGTDHNIEYFDANRESLYAAIQTLMDGTLAGELVCSRDGKLWAEVSARATDAAASAFPLNMLLENYDWRGTVRIDEIQTKKTSFLEMGGIYFPGPGNESTPYLASAPGSSPAYRGSAEKTSGLALGSDQADLNTLVGNVFAWKNARYPSVQIDLAGNYRNIDIAPLERIQLTMSSEDNIRELSWSQKNFVVNGMDFEYDPAKGLLLPSLDLHEITQGIAGATITIPDIPPTNGAPGDAGGGFDIPSIQIPPFPGTTITIIQGGGSTGSSGGYYPRFAPVMAGAISGTAIPLTPLDVGPGGAGAVKCSFDEDMSAAGWFRTPIDYTGDLFIVPMAYWDNWGAGSTTPIVTTSYRALAPNLSSFPPTISHDLYETDTGGSNHTMNFQVGSTFGNVGVHVYGGNDPQGDVVSVEPGSLVSCYVSKPATSLASSPKYFYFMGWWIVYASAWTL